MATATSTRTRGSTRNSGADPSFSTSSVSGVPLLWTKTPGLKRLVLSFRVGFADEALHERGLSHVCEHLALRQFRDETFAFNGFIEATRTVFFAQGTDKQLVHFARGVTEALANLPEEDFATERRVLRAESAMRPMNDVDWLLRFRYGSLGPGVGSYPEYGLYEDKFEHAVAWSQRYFTAANAVAWCSGPPPRGLKFALEAGRSRIPVTDFEELDDERPSFVRRNGGLALGFNSPSDPAFVVAGFVLEHRLRNRLRHESSTSYSVVSNHVRLGLDVSHVSVHADVAPREGQAAVDELARVLDELETDGCRRDELDTFHTLSAQAALQDGAELSLLDRASQRILFGGRPVAAKTWQAKLKRVSASDVAEAIGQLRAQLIYLIPQDAHAPSGAVQVRENSPTRVEGRSFTATHSGKSTLVVGNEGATYALNQQQLTVTRNETQLVLTWADGSRAALGNDAVSIGISPQDWIDSGEALGLFDAAFEGLPTVRAGRRRTLPTGVRPKPFAEGFRAAFDGRANQRAQQQLSKKELVRVNVGVGIGGVLGLGAVSFGMLVFQTSTTVVEKLIAALLCIGFTYASVIAWKRVSRFSKQKVSRNSWLLDSARWHIENGRIPDDLPTSTAYVQGGLLLGWLASRSMLSNWMLAEGVEELTQFNEGRLSGPGLLREWDGVLASDMLSEQAARFCAWYFGSAQKRFNEDIAAIRGNAKTAYHMPDTPEIQAAFNQKADASYAHWSKLPGRRVASDKPRQADHGDET